MLPKIEEQYAQLLTHIKNNGHEITDDRTGVGTKKDFGHFIKLDVDETEFPILTSKSVHFKSTLDVKRR